MVGVVLGCGGVVWARVGVAWAGSDSALGAGLWVLPLGALGDAPGGLWGLGAAPRGLWELLLGGSGVWGLPLGGSGGCPWGSLGSGGCSWGALGARRGGQAGICPQQAPCRAPTQRSHHRIREKPSPKRSWRG